MGFWFFIGPVCPWGPQLDNAGRTRSGGEGIERCWSKGVPPSGYWCRSTRNGRNPLPLAKPFFGRLDGWSRMTREDHVRFWAGAGVKLPRATHLQQDEEKDETLSHAARSVTANAQPSQPADRLPRPTSGSPAAQVGSRAKCLIFKRDGLMTRHRWKDRWSGSEVCHERNPTRLPGNGQFRDN